MARYDRWLIVAWSLIAAAAWAFNASIALDADEVSAKGVAVVGALTLVGLALGIALTAAISAWRAARPGARQGILADAQTSWFIPMGIGIVGLTATSAFGETIGTMDWILLALGSVAGGFIMGASLGIAAPANVP